TGTILRVVAHAGRGAAHRAAGLEEVHARVGGSQAVVGRVVVAHPALRGARTRRRRGGEPVRGADGATARAVFRHVALARRGAAHARGRLERARGRAAGGGRPVHARALIALLGAVDGAVTAIGVVEGQIDLAEVRGARVRRVRI